jgi:hypothetical protein
MMHEIDVGQAIRQPDAKPDMEAGDRSACPEAQ